MKFIKTGKLDPNILESKLDLQPFQGVQKVLLRLNCLLGLINDYYPNKLGEFVTNLQAELRKLIVEKQEEHEETINLLEDLSNLKDYPELAELVLQHYLQVLQIPENADWKKETMKVVQKNEFLSFLLPRYYNLLALIKTIGREEAVKLYRRYESKFLKNRGDPYLGDYIGAKEIFEGATQPTQNPGPWVMIRGITPNGKYFFRNENCMWIDVLADLPDKEMKYLICCYGDYQNANYRSGQSVVLTMEHSIALGDPYCSRVLHDTAADWDLRHPPKEFWDNLEYTELEKS
ncbi:MAG: hypothetical protein ACXAD7_18960 [Candidatus Kariarchaeaceae archaeon]|jgi:hypothetical protein